MRRKRARTWLTILLLGLLLTACEEMPAATPEAVAPTTAPTATSPPALPTSSPTPATSALLFQDDFSDPNSGWETGAWDAGQVGYGDGHYVVSATARETPMWGAAGQRFDDAAIDVDATQVTAGPANNNDYGVACRVQPNGDGYYLLISGDGAYAIYRAVDGAFETLVDWTASEAIRQGNATNHVRAVCDGARLALVVNDVPLVEAQDGAFAAGDIALTATTYEDQPTEIHFDDVQVSAVGGSAQAPQPTPAPASAVDTTSPIVLTDDFSDPNSGWGMESWDTGAVGYEDGAYVVIAAQNGTTVWGATSQTLDDIQIDVDATQVAAGPLDNNDYGVICRLQPNGDGYYLLISGDRSYAIYRAVDEAFEPLVAWTTSDAIRPGNATNHIQAICDGARLALVVNDVPLAETQDGTFSQGGIAFTATTYEDQPTEIHFDDLVVTRAGGESAPPPLAGAGIERYTDPALIEGMLVSALAPYRLEHLEVNCTTEVVRISFEQPDDLGVGRAHALYLSLLDLAALQAPFVPRIELAIKINDEPILGVSAPTSVVQAWHRGEIDLETLNAALQIVEVEG